MFRLLVGEAPTAGYGVDATLDLRQMFRHKIAEDIAEMGFNREHAHLVDSLVHFLLREDVAVRRYNGSFLHAKAYIFDRISFVGSSNFTPSGLTRNSELALTNYSESSSQALHTWFETKWAIGIDCKADLIETLQASKFGAKIYTPFEVFIKALYEYFKDRLVLLSDGQASIELARFQEEGRLDAIRLLDKWGGVIIADAVGLGKTFIGLSLLEHELLTRRRKGYVPRALLICPAQLRDLVWRPRIQQFGIPGVEIRSQEELGSKDFDWKTVARTVDLVLVDESHNFRNPNTNRADHLMRLLGTGKKKRVVLMTATPVNNTIFDLYQQIRYLTRGDDYHYRSLGIVDLKGYFKGVQHQGLEIFDLLEATTVRRSRADIRRRQQAGDEVVVNGQPVHFPERHLERLEYDLDSTYQGFYGDIVADIDRLYLVAYNLSQFIRKPNHQSRHTAQANAALIALLKMLYLKRLESSTAAFASSLQRQVAFQRRFLQILKTGKLLDTASYRKLLLIDTDDDSAGEQIQDFIDQLPTVDAAHYDLPKITSLVELDVATLETLQMRVQTVLERTTTADGDDKLRQVKRLLAGPLREQKVLIFTSYHDTAQYLYHQLVEDAPWQHAAAHPAVAVITGATKGDERERLVQRFAPRANRPPSNPGDPPWHPPADAIRILISTDVLSEGQNLQDAGVIINYDLHWNPVRLIQRAGRVDRIGSPYEHIALYNVFPEDALESLLGIVARLSQRIAEIDRTVGLDGSVLGEVISERSLEQIRRLHANDQQVMADIESQAELLSTEDMKFPLIQYIQQLGEHIVADIPMGIHSGKGYRARNARPGTFLAFRAADQHFWRFYPADGGDPETRMQVIYAMIACDREEPRVDPGPPPYDLIERATRDIVATLHVNAARNLTPPPMTSLTRKLYHWLNSINLWQDNPDIDQEVRHRLNAVLQQVSLKPFERDKALRRIMTAFEQTNNFPQFVESFDTFCHDMDLYGQTSTDEAIIEAIKEEDLQLVCYMILCP